MVMDVVIIGLKKIRFYMVRMQNKIQYLLIAYLLQSKELTMKLNQLVLDKIILTIN